MQLQFVMAGMSIGHTPVEVLERVALTEHSLPAHLAALGRHTGGGVIVSTCNRTEVYGVTGDPEAALLHLREFLGLLARRGSEQAPDLEPYIYTAQGDQAVRHLFRVTAGLESIAIGETQVAGQVTRALQAAGEAGVVEPQLSRMFHAALRTSRRVRQATGIGRESISISSISVQLVQREAHPLNARRVLLVGAGETGTLAARALRRIGVGDLAVASRRTERAAALAEELGATALPFADMPAALAAADVVLACTAATDPVITAEAVSTAMAARPDRPMLIVDLGLPRDIEPAAAGVANVSLYSLDQLQAVAEENRQSRVEASAEASQMIDRAVERFNEQVTGMDSEPVIRTLGARAEAMRQEELSRALRRLPGLDPSQVETLDAMTRALVRRILADPITFLRSEPDPAAAEAVLQVFDLYGDDEDE